MCNNVEIHAAISVKNLAYNVLVYIPPHLKPIQATTLSLLSLL